MKARYSILIMIFAAAVLMASRFVPYKNDFDQSYENNYDYGYGFDRNVYRGYNEDDLVHIQITDDEIIGIRNGRRVSAVDLHLDESVRWYGEMGRVGVVLTTERLMGLSTRTNWKILDLGLSENLTSDIMLSPHLALAVSSKRIMVFDSWMGRWATTPFPIHDEFKQEAIGLNVAVVLTSRRAFGYALGKTFFKQVDIRTGENVKSLEVTAKSATLRTDRRLLIFTAGDASWSRVDLDE